MKSIIAFFKEVIASINEARLAKVKAYLKGKIIKGS